MTTTITTPTSPPDAGVPTAAPDGASSSPRPIDRDWRLHERAARADSGDDEDTDEPYGDPASVRDEGVLESLGKSISSPVIEAEQNGKT